MKKLTCLSLIFVLLYFFNCRGIRFVDESETSAIVTNCKKIYKLNDGVEYLEIADSHCKNITPLIFTNLSLSNLVVNSSSINFPLIDTNTFLKKLSIINPILDEIPEIVYQSPQLKQLIVFIKNDTYDDVLMKKLIDLEKVRLGIIHMKKLPNFIYHLENLKELRILTKNNMTFKFTDSEGLKKIEVLDAPIDISENISILLSLKELRILNASRFSNIEEEAVLLKQLPFLEEICLPELSEIELEILYEVLPDVRVVCQDNLILPFNW